jgi:hypothetical protein
MSFVMPEAKQALFSEDLPNTGWVGAVRAAYVSFAVNLPGVAATQLKNAMATTSAQKWSENWSVHVIRMLTFGGGIGLYTTRYDGIRPVLETLYSVTLPKNSRALAEWKPSKSLIVPPSQPDPETKKLPSLAPPALPIIVTPELPRELGTSFLEEAERPLERHTIWTWLTSIFRKS